MSTVSAWSSAVWPVAMRWRRWRGPGVERGVADAARLRLEALPRRAPLRAREH